MQSKLSKIIISSLAVIIVAIVAVRVFAPPLVEKSLNKNIDLTGYVVSSEAKALHADLNIMDWHADTLLWSRDFLAQSDYGQVDLPRLKKGNVSIQMLTTVTKTPAGLNIHENTDTNDNITKLAIVQGWPARTWGSILERALYQSEKLNTYVEEADGQLVFIKSQADLKSFQNNQSGAVAVLLGTEGSHPLEGKLENIDRMYDAGFRMFGITHFFDNELGGSLHGVSKAGLTDFGRAAVRRMDELNIIIDLAHASEKSAREVLALTKRPHVVSHTGIKGACDTARNFTDDLMKAIAAKGGLIAIGYWQEASCDPSPAGIAKSIKYGIDLVGADHIALGSDWDGSVEVIPSDKIAAITDALLKADVAEEDIRKVMGENSINFLKRWLPET